MIDILRDPLKSYEQAKKNDINEFINRGSQFLEGRKIYKLKNILLWMLEEKEENRISSVKLGLICQMDELFQTRFKMPYQKIFPP